MASRQSAAGAQGSALPPETSVENLKAEGRKLASEAKDAVSGIAEQRKRAAADYMRGMAAAIDRGAGELDQQGRSGTASLVRQTSGEIERLAHRVLEREPRQLLHDLEDFARRRPALCIGISALAGFGLMRFLKSSETRNRPPHGSAVERRP
jgi:hypothetical protein